MKVWSYLRYARFKAFKAFLKPISAAFRKKRIALFVDSMPISEGTRILDLGGTPYIWDLIDTPLNITILNLPGSLQRAEQSHHDITYIEGDACNVEDFEDNAFDLVYSNSVIEHVGPTEKQRAFAREAQRLANSYWVQTPSKWFPIEAHCGMPFWWFYPQSLRTWLIEKWRKKLPAWTEMVEETRVLEREFFHNLFPGSNLHTETLCCIPKSYTVWLNNLDANSN